MGIKNKVDFMKTFFFIYFLITVFVTPIFPQRDSLVLPQEPASSLILRAGLNDYHLLDKYLSPFIYNGIIFVSDLSFQVKGKNSDHTVKLLFSTGKISSNDQPGHISPYIGYISYAYTHAIDSWNVFGEPLQFNIGAGLSSFFEYLTLRTDSKTTNSIYYDDSWYVSHAINLHLYGKYNLDEQRSVSLLITTPIIRLITRPSNGHYFNQANTEIIDENKLKILSGGRLEFLWDNLVLLTEIKYQTPISDRFNFHTEYIFGYASSDKPASLLSLGTYMNNFLVGIECMF